MLTIHPDCCPFCKIVRREDPDAREIYRDQHVVVFLPADPAVLGHTMIVPRNHVPDIWSLDEETAGYLARATIGLAWAVRQAVAPEGLNIIQSNGNAATQTVFHLHVHLVPRWEADAMGPIWPEATDFSDEEKDATLERLRNACRAVQHW